MKLKTFHIRLSKEHIFSDENKINEFLTGKQVINTFASLVNVDKLNFWSVVVTYTEQTETKIEKLSYSSETELTEKEQEIYDNLKKWRVDKAAVENVPTYVVAHDKELITIAKQNIEKLDDFKNIKGFGKKKIDKYGDDIIALLNSL